MPKQKHHALLFGNPHHQSTHALNETIAALQRKTDLVRSDGGDRPSSSKKGPSFKMNAILHPGKGKEGKRSDSVDRDPHRSNRRSLTGGLLSHSRTKDGSSAGSPRLAPVTPAKFDVIIESPPLVLYGSTSNSTGALLSGRLKLSVTDPSNQVKITKLVMALNAAIYTRKPVAKDCLQCSKRINDLNTWKFLSEPKTFLKDQDNQFPFSYLVPGHLPATTNSHLGTINYYLEVQASTSEGEDVSFVHPLKLDRAIPPGLDKSSVRIFPPTSLTARLTMPPVIHPIGTFPLQLTLSGVVDKKEVSQTRWRLRKVMWRVEELTKMISAPCSKHGHKVGGDGKALQHSDERTIGADEIKGGWKTDFDTKGGEITLEFEGALSTSRQPICDMSSPAGLEVKHTLVLELIIAEEFCPNRNTSLITPTGAARVLRMQFALSVSARAGMGISWDEEMPPVYEDVPSSPPMYGISGSGSPRIAANQGRFAGGILEDYNGPELDYVDIERLDPTSGSDPNAPPVYRERDPAEYAGIMDALRRERGNRPPGTPSYLRPVGLASPGLGPSLGPAARGFRGRLGTGDSLASIDAAEGRERVRAGGARGVRMGFSEEDFEIEPLERREDDSERREGGEGRAEEDVDVGEGETAQGPS